MGELTSGLSATVSWPVTAERTAAQVGSGLVNVFSTPMLVALMENAAVATVGNALSDELTTVGTRIDVRHLAATPIGGTVQATATLTEVDGRRLVFEIEATDDTERIGHATHERVIVNKAKFEAKAEQKRQPE